MEKLYENIRTYRKARGMSQEELARLTGYTDRSSIAKIEKGVVDLQQSKIVLFARVLDVPVLDLLGWADSPHTAPEPPQTVNYTLTAREGRVIEKYRRLDEIDKGKIDERMDTMLEDEKYKRGESSDVREIS